MILLFFWRAVYYWVLLRDSLVENVLILGTGEQAKELAREILERKDDGYRVVGFLTDDPSRVGERLVNPSIIGTLDQIPALDQQFRVDTLLVALEDRRGKLPLPELLRYKLDGMRVEESASFYEMLTGKIPVRNLHPSSLIFSNGFNSYRLFYGTRRVPELLLALISFLISLPVFLLACLLIFLESGRPIFYRQERVGEKGRTFELLKLRSMRQDAEEETGAVWASADDDPRITRIGRFLRKSRIDELPQLFNIIKGEMSFVGPRPERPCFVEKLQQLIPYYGERHCVKPGITGWAQVRYRYGSSVEDAEEKLRYDLYYIKHMSFWLDFVIVLDTIRVILLGKGR
jgi:sugar transferase (PEP-CTERM system associated)